MMVINRFLGSRSYDLIWSMALLIVGTLLEGLGYVVFLIPTNIAPGGISGLAIVFNEFLPIPISLIIFLANMPILLLALKMLGGKRTLILSLMSVLLFSASLEFLPSLVDTPQGVSDDAFLNALFGGITVGLGIGLIHRAGGTAGGTATLGRILQHRFGIPLSSSYMYTDTFVVLAAGLTFGWEASMLGMVALFVSGAANDYVLEGPSLIRTVTIITDKPDEVAQVIMQDYGRGVTAWQGTGMYTQRMKHILFVSVTRSQVASIQQAVQDVDPLAFLVISHGHRAYGWRNIKPKKLKE